MNGKRKSVRFCDDFLRNDRLFNAIEDGDIR